MNENEIRDKILEIFKNERQNPDADFDESHFMDFLTHPPHKKSKIKNSFRGVRKYNLFMDEIELEFGICFRLADLDRTYSVDGLTKKVQERLNQKRGNIAVLKTRRNPTFIFEIAFTLLMVFVFIWKGPNLALLALTPIYIIVIFWTLRNKIHDRNHKKKLSLVILGGKE